MEKNVAVLVMCALPLLHADASCTYGETAPTAILEKELVLSCSLTCFSNVYEWFNITDGNVRLSTEKNSTFVVSEKVHSVTEVGGHKYMCQCNALLATECFRIGVKPKVQLNTSVLVTRLGMSVNVTCTAESYPPASTVGNYLMRHPRDQNITTVLLPGKNGVVHIISGASMNDSGEYECTVTVKLDEYSTQLQSDNVVAKLTVYDPPKISGTKNFTISANGQSAILECNIRSTDSEDFVTWTTSSNRTLKETHATIINGKVFYLLLCDAVPGDYFCHVFSAHSPEDKPEDSRRTSVLMKDCSLPATGATITGGVEKKIDDDDITCIVIAVFESIVLLITWSVIVVWGLCKVVRKSNKYRFGQLPSPPNGERRIESGMDIREPVTETIQPSCGPVEVPVSEQQQVSLTSDANRRERMPSSSSNGRKMEDPVCKEEHQPKMSESEQLDSRKDQAVGRDSAKKEHSVQEAEPSPDEFSSNSKLPQTSENSNRVKTRAHSGSSSSTRRRSLSLPTPPRKNTIKNTTKEERKGLIIQEGDISHDEGEPDEENTGK